MVRKFLLDRGLIRIGESIHDLIPGSNLYLLHFSESLARLPISRWAVRGRSSEYAS